MGGRDNIDDRRAYCSLRVGKVTVVICDDGFCAPMTHEVAHASSQCQNVLQLLRHAVPHACGGTSERTEYHGHDLFTWGVLRLSLSKPIIYFLHDVQLT